MRRVLLLLVAVILAVPCAHAADPLTVPAGSARTVQMHAAVTRIVIAEPSLLDASVVDEHDVQLVGLRAGQTTVAIYTADPAETRSFGVSVTAPANPLLGPMPGAAPSASVPRPVSAARLQRLLHAHPDLAGLTVANGGQQLLLGGSTGSLLAHQEAEAVAGAAGASVNDLSRVGGTPLVSVDIRFAAISVSTLQELGFNFTGLGRGFQGAVAAPNTISGITASSDFSGLSSLTSALPLASAFSLLLSKPDANITSVISALTETGLTTLLAEPTLVVRSGEQAAFLAGGQVPIPVPQGGSAAGTITITYHDYGVKLNVAPTVLSPDRISLTVSPEVSEIDTANALDVQGYAVPAFLTRSTSTTVELGDGQTLVLAGLIYSSTTVNESKFPWLGDIPIIGNFFKTTSNSRQRQELIVLATPHLVHPLNGDQLPPLPGEEAAALVNPSIGDMLLNRMPLDAQVRHYGLMR